MNSSQANSREYQRQAIDAEIRSLEESLRALRFRRNALAPISSLPPEIFAAIFSFSRLPASGTTPLGGEPDRHLSWLRVAHVCHQWREVALNLPFFWSHVDFTTLSLAGATEMLVRAKSVPLYLEAWVPARYWNGAQFSTFLQPRVSQICHLAISAESFHFERVLEGLVSPAPTLEYLSLSVVKYCDGAMWVRPPIPDSLFDGSTPRLSFLELSDCDINWKSPLLRGLKYLKIRTPTADARPSLSVWLDALDEMPQLKTLGLHSASPITSSFPFDVERTVTLPSLTRLDISTSAGNCGLALAHLVLPALTSLCITALSGLPNAGDVQELLPYVVRHAHGPQDTLPLQSVLIRGAGGVGAYADIIAWPVPDIDVEVDTPTLLAATLSPRVALSVRSTDLFDFDTYIEILDTAMAALPLDSLVMLTAQHLYDDLNTVPLHYEQFWLRHAPRWPLLRRVRLASLVQDVLIKILLEDNGGRESPLLPSLTELVVVSAPLDEPWTLRLCDTLMKRVEQGIPLEMLDLRSCVQYSPTEVPLLSEIVVDVLGPSETIEERTQIRDMWDPVVRGLFFEGNNSGAED